MAAVAGRLVGRFLGNAVSESLAFAAGVAIGPVLGPPVQALRNSVNEAYPFVPPPAVTLAQGVAQGQVDPKAAAKWAAQNGIGKAAFDALVAIADVGPAFGLLMEAWRRDLLTKAEFETGLNRLAIEREWWDALESLRDVLLSPADLANARQQGFVDQARQHAESQLQGVDSERAEILFELAGLPPGVETGLELLRRGIIDEATFQQIVREGHTKVKYTDDLLQLRDRILSPATYATLHLKGHIDQAQMHAGGALSGETPENMDLLYLSMGRPAAPGQLWTAAARGVDGPLGRPLDFAQFQQAIAESDIRPEYGQMLWDIRYLYPSLFQLTRLVSSGAIDVATASDWATKARYAPEVVKALVQAWQRGSGATKKGLTATDLETEYQAGLSTSAEYQAGLVELGYTAKDAATKVKVSDAKRRRQARAQLVNRTHARYTGWHVDQAEARTALTAAGLDQAESDELLGLWDAERSVNVHTLTEAQVVRATRKGFMDQATAEERLLELGLSQADIATRLAI